jgi:hypothetical protein
LATELIFSQLPPLITLSEASQTTLTEEFDMAAYKIDAKTDSVLLESTATPAQPELLVSAVLHLMSHYNANRNEAGACVKLASVIERHLKALADLPDLAPVLRATCQQLAEQWAGVVEHAMPQSEKRSLFGRLAPQVRHG